MDISNSFINISDQLNIFDDYTDILSNKPIKEEITTDTLLKEILTNQNSLSNRCNLITESQILILNRLEILTKEQNKRFLKIEDDLSDIKITLTMINNKISKNDTAEMYSQIRKYGTKQGSLNPLGFVKLDHNLLKM